MSFRYNLWWILGVYSYKIFQSLSIFLTLLIISFFLFFLLLKLYIKITLNTWSSDNFFYLSLFIFTLLLFMNTLLIPSYYQNKIKINKLGTVWFYFLRLAQSKGWMDPRFQKLDLFIPINNSYLLLIYIRCW